MPPELVFHFLPYTLRERKCTLPTCSFGCRHDFSYFKKYVEFETSNKFGKCRALQVQCKRYQCIVHDNCNVFLILRMFNGVILSEMTMTPHNDKPGNSPRDQETIQKLQSQLGIPPALIPHVFETKSLGPNDNKHVVANMYDYASKVTQNAALLTRINNPSTPLLTDENSNSFTSQYQESDKQIRNEDFTSYPNQHLPYEYNVNTNASNSYIYESAFNPSLNNYNNNNNNDGNTNNNDGNNNYINGAGGNNNYDNSNGSNNAESNTNNSLENDTNDNNTTANNNNNSNNNSNNKVSQESYTDTRSDEEQEQCINENVNMKPRPKNNYYDSTVLENGHFGKVVKAFSRSYEVAIAIPDMNGVLHPIIELWDYTRVRRGVQASSAFFKSAYLPVSGHSQIDKKTSCEGLDKGGEMHEAESQESATAETEYVGERAPMTEEKGGSESSHDIGSNDSSPRMLTKMEGALGMQPDMSQMGGSLDPLSRKRPLDDSFLSVGNAGNNHAMHSYRSQVIADNMNGANNRISQYCTNQEIAMMRLRQMSQSMNRNIADRNMADAGSEDEDDYYGEGENVMPGANTTMGMMRQRLMSQQQQQLQHSSQMMQMNGYAPPMMKMGIPMYPQRYGNIPPSHMGYYPPSHVDPSKSHGPPRMQQEMNMQGLRNMHYPNIPSEMGGPPGRQAMNIAAGMNMHANSGLNMHGNSGLSMQGNSGLSMPPGYQMQYTQSNMYSSPYGNIPGSNPNHSS